MTPQGNSSPLERGLQLSDRIVCMIHSGNLQCGSRLLQEMSALRQAGVRVVLLSAIAQEKVANDGFTVIRANAPETLPAEDSKPGTPLQRLWRVLRGSAPTPVGFDKQLAQIIHDEKIDAAWMINWPMLSRYGATARHLGVPIVYETLDLLPEQALSAEEREVQRDLERSEVLGLAAFITAGVAYADYYEERYTSLGVPRPFVRDNAPDTQVAQPRPTSRPVRCLFLGNVTKNRNLPNVVAAVAASTEDFTLTLQGENRLGDTLSELVRELNLQDRVFIEAPVPPSEIVETAARFDVGIASLEPVSMNERLAATTKIFTYMAAGLAVIGSDLPGIRSTVGRHSLGALVPSTSVEDWARALDSVCGLPLQEIDALKLRSLASLEEHSWEIQGPQFLEEFARAMTGRKGRRR